MKLFIWNKPYQVDYGMSLLFAIAETEEEAREQALTGAAIAFGDMRDRELDKKKVLSQLGKPDRVLEAPAAEWHRWSE